MKRFFSVVLIAVMLFSFAACKPVSKDSIQPAIYRMEDDTFPRLYLRESGQFSFIVNPSSSSNFKGTYSVSDGVLKLETTEGPVYCFNIKRDALTFNAELSDEFIGEKPTKDILTDGAKLDLWHLSYTHPSTEA